MILLVITIAALIAYLALGEKFVRLREVTRLTYFAALLVLLLQYGVYLNSTVKELLR